MKDLKMSDILVRINDNFEDLEQEIYNIVNRGWNDYLVAMLKDNWDRQHLANRTAKILFRITEAGEELNAEQIGRAVRVTLSIGAFSSEFPAYSACPFGPHGAPKWLADMCGVYGELRAVPLSEYIENCFDEDEARYQWEFDL